MTDGPREAAGFEQLLDYRRRLLDGLEQQPAAFAAQIAAIPADDWPTRRDAQGRNVLQVAFHVRDLETGAYRTRIHRILTEDQPTLAPDLDHTAFTDEDDPPEPMTAILAAWSQARAEIVEWLRPLTPAGWSRTGFYSPAGNRSVQWWAERAYAHAREHQQALRE
jgi:hypothetical protein